MRNGIHAVLFVMLAGCGRVWFAPQGEVDASLDSMMVSCGHTFCDDFERTGPLEEGWDSATNSGLAMPAIDNGQYLVQLPGTSLEGAWLEKQLPKVTASIVVHVRLGWDSPTPGAAEVDLVQLQWLALPGTCTSFGYYLVRDGTGPFNLQETYGGCGGNEQNYLSSLDNSGLHEAVMTVTLGEVGTARIVLELDGATVVDRMTSHAIAESELLLRVGGGASRDVVAPWDIRFDDLYVDVR